MMNGVAGGPETEILAAQAVARAASKRRRKILFSTR
jgi:hypothetical protein